MKKAMTLFVTCTLAMALLVGCVPQKSDNGASAAPKKDSSVADTAKESNLNATGMPIVKEKVTYEMAAKSRHNKNFAELEFFTELEKQTNINIKWNMSSEDGWKEKKGLLFAGDLPDAFYGQGILTDVDVIKYASQGLLIPLNDLIDKYAPNVKALIDGNAEYKKQLTAPDGNIYALPNLTELAPTTHDKLFINKKWLDKLNLPAPTTLDEFEATLKAFRDNDLTGNGDTKDEIPFSFKHNTKENGLYSMFGSFGQVDRLDHFIVKDKKVLYTATTEPYKDGINYFHKLFKENLIDKEAFTHDFNVFIAKLKAPEKTVGSFLGWSLSSAAGANKEDYIPLAPLKGKDGKQIWNTYNAAISAKGSFCITNKAKDPEVLVRWVDTHFDPETSLQIDQGLIGKTLEKSAEGKFSYLPVPEGKSFTEMIHDYSPGVNSVGAVTRAVADKLTLNANLQERADLDKFFAPFNIPVEETYPSVYFTIEEVEKISVLETDIKAYVDQTYADWIVNGGADKAWDGYVKKLGEMKVDEYVQIYQSAYDRYEAN